MTYEQEANLRVMWLEEKRRREKAEAECDELKAACKELCDAIRLVGSSRCNTVCDGPSLEYIEEHWIEHVAQCLADAWGTGRDAIAKAKEAE